MQKPWCLVRVVCLALLQPWFYQLLLKHCDGQPCLYSHVVLQREHTISNQTALELQFSLPSHICFLFFLHAPTLYLSPCLCHFFLVSKTYTFSNLKAPVKIYVWYISLQQTVMKAKFWRCGSGCMRCERWQWKGPFSIWIGASLCDDGWALAFYNPPVCSPHIYNEWPAIAITNLWGFFFLCMLAELQMERFAVPWLPCD